MGEMAGDRRTLIDDVALPTWFPSTVGDPADFKPSFFRGWPGDPNEVLPNQPLPPPPLEEPPKRGLVLRSLLLKQTEAGWFKRLFRHDPEELYVVSIGIDLSGDTPFVWPYDQESADRSAIKVRAGERHEFRFGLGHPIYLPKVIVGGLALSILIAESKAKERERWSHVAAATAAVNSDGAIHDFLSLAKFNPAVLVANAGVEALARTIGIVSQALSAAGDDNLGSFQGIFPAEASWVGMLSDDQPDLVIELEEISG